MRSIPRVGTIAIVAAGMALGPTPMPLLAQEASPAAACPATTPEENEALVRE